MSISGMGQSGSTRIGCETDISEAKCKLLEPSVLMDNIIAHCGIICSDCPTFKATKVNSDVERKRVAELWTREYGRTFRPEDINCDGCLTKGTRIFSHTGMCEIRKCAQEKNLKNCAHCNDYECEKISKLHEQAPKAKETLDRVRKNLDEDAKR